MATITTEREALRRLVDELPDDELAEAIRVLEYLAGLAEHPAIRALNEAPIASMEDDETEIVEEIRRWQALGDEVFVSHREARRILLGDDE